MTFCIQLSGKTDFEKLKSSAVTYGSAFKKSGVPFEKIVFSSYNSLGARAVFAAMPCDYDGILFHSVKPLFLIRAYGDRYRICSDELLTSFCK